MPFKCRLVATIREAIAPRPRIGRVVALVSGVTALAALSLPLVFACLPDLETAAPRAKAPGACGDELIDLDAGEMCDPGEAGAVPGCTAGCAIDCPADGIVEPKTHHCYFAPAEPRTGEYSQARASCGPFAHVVTFNSDAERSFVYARFGTALDARFWVGLDFRPSSGGYLSAHSGVEPGWASDCRGCFARMASDADAANVGVDRGCLADDPRADVYTAIGCRQQPQLSIVCEREPPGVTSDPCAGGSCITVPETLGKKRYLYVPVAVAADDAIQGCRALGGSLAMFDTASERESVLIEMQRAVSKQDDGTWIGLAHEADAGGVSFVWDDNEREDARPPVWASGEPRSTSGDLRAIVMAVTVSEVDLQLARAVTTTESHPYLCQY